MIGLRASSTGSGGVGVEIGILLIDDAREAVTSSVSESILLTRVSVKNLFKENFVGKSFVGFPNTKIP